MMRLILSEMDICNGYEEILRQIVFYLRHDLILFSSVLKDIVYLLRAYILTLPVVFYQKVLKNHRFGVPLLLAYPIVKVLVDSQPVAPFIYYKNI
eukprot:SAG11_NODE_246_length_11683_cov_15.540142_9_plen_95_part_00